MLDFYLIPIAMLSGLISLWIYPMECKASILSMTWRAIIKTVLRVNFLLLSFCCIY
jgi:hypothetical protein